MAPACRRVWEHLFGQTPDRSTRNYLLHRYLRLVYASGFGDSLTHYDSRVTDGVSNSLDRPWTQYGKISILPADGKLGVITIPQSLHGHSVIDQLMTVTPQAIQTVNGVSPIIEQEAMIPETGIIIWLSPGLTGTYTVQARLRPFPPAEFQPGLTGDLAYVTATHPFADRFRKVVTEATEWPLRLAGVVAALGCRIAFDRGGL